MNKTKYKKILIIQTAFLGDVILMSPLIRAFHETFPDTEIDVLTNPGTRALFNSHPYIINNLSFDKSSALNKFFSFIKMIIQIRKNKYELAISIHHSFTSSMLMVLGGISERIGFKKLRFATKRIFHEKGLHIKDRYLKIMKAFSEEKFDNQTEIYWNDAEEKKVQEIFKLQVKDGEKTIGIAPGSVWVTKMWPSSYYEELMVKLKKENFKIFLLGGPGERELCSKIIKNSQSGAVNMAGELSITESAALINKMDLMLTNDSAPLHIANAVQTDVFSFFGPTVKKFGCYPFRTNDKIFEVDLACRPCGKHGSDKCPQGHFECMKKITPEFVYKNIIGYFNEK
ncbi:MAG: lipopolysaccharide heptosyltransferase II [Calditrichia bacterium]|nr:lipopolysaccharide heptosyltransferase II [Calditrichia bacterium]